MDGNGSEFNLFADTDRCRIPLLYLASLFAAGNEGLVRYSLRKQQAVRQFRRAVTAGDITVDEVASSLLAADCTPQEADAIYRLTVLSTVAERFVIPPLHREVSLDGVPDTSTARGTVGFEGATRRKA